MKLPILIIGSGPSGASAAIFLARAGYEVIIMDHRSPTPLMVGESLPPNAVTILQQLEVWEAFQKAEHLICYGNQSAWGNSKIHYTDFIFQPPGYGWHLDRVTFEEMLRKKARQLGANIRIPAKVVKANFNQKKWTVAWKNQENEVHQESFSFIIDASGRQSWLSRMLPIKKLHGDRQLALIAFLKIQNPNFSQNHSLIETNKEGWWYSAQIPRNIIATSYLCDPSPEQRKLMIQPKNWWELLSQTQHSQKRIQQSQAQLIQPPTFVSAESFRLEKLFGPGWLVIGDAGLCYDPISSHGILMSMLAAREGAKALIQYFSDRSQQGLISFQKLMFQSYDDYLQQRQQFYNAERRFPESDYWPARKKRK